MYDVYTFEKILANGKAGIEACRDWGISTQVMVDVGHISLTWWSLNYGLICLDVQARSLELFKLRKPSAKPLPLL